MQSFQNLQVVKREQVEEFARWIILPISKAAEAVSEKSSLHMNYLMCHKTHFKLIAALHKTDRIWTERERAFALGWGVNSKWRELWKKVLG